MPVTSEQDLPKSRALEMLRGGSAGVMEWNALRRAVRPAHSEFVYDLSEVDLVNARLAHANLRFVKLDDSDLTGAWLHSADLTRATLRNCQLERASFQFAELSRCRFDGARLAHTFFSRCDLGGSEWRGATLHRTSLIYSNLADAYFKEVSFETVYFDGSNLAKARFEDCVFSWLNFSAVHLVDMDVTPFIPGYRHFSHGLDNYVDWKAVAKSIHDPRLADFLMWLGVPPVFATYLIDCARSIDKRELFSMLQSTFISYGSPDSAFAKRLHEALSRNGVRAFLFERDAVPGERLSRMMNTGVNDYDRVVLICSKSALSRLGVRNEIQLSLDREAREGGSDRLIPITLDDYVFGDWWPERPDSARAIRDKVVADFRDTGHFDEQMIRLLDALKKKA